MHKFDDGGRPGDRRGFLHKKIFGAISTVAGLLPIPGGNLVSRITGALAGRGGGTGTAAPCPPGFPGCPRSSRFPGLGFSPDGGGAPCPSGTVRVTLPNGETPCLSRKSRMGIRQGLSADFGEAVNGQFGVALEPAVRTLNIRFCPRGAVLGSDGLCYDRKTLRNTDREWPRGRRPLLTGGEMRAISIAARAAKKLGAKQKQLRSMGMLPPLPKPRAAPKQLTRGKTVLIESGPGSVVA